MPLTSAELGAHREMRPGEASNVESQTGKTQQSLHIWEQPLPQPGIGTSTGSTGCYQGNFSTLPCHGTGTVGSGQGGSGSVGTNSTAERGWPGTHSYYDQEKGWMGVTDKK